MRIRVIRLVSCLFALLPFHASAFAGDVTISAAASLKEVVNELADSFSRRNPGVKIAKNFGASGTLAKQIESGAPADIFISANEEWMAYLKERRLVSPGSAGVFTFNTLVFAGATTRKVTGMRDLTTLGRIAMGSPKGVPAGEYASEAIRKAGLERELSGKLVLARDVREGMMYAERGEVDGAFVYRTDALQGKRAKILFTVPQRLYPRVLYPMALTTSGARNSEAVAFFRYLQGPEAKGALTRFGFTAR